MKLSVVLPTYNESTWLTATITKIISSINNSDFHNSSEIIIIDDGSTDNTAAIISAIVGEYKSKKIKIIVHRQKNSGRYRAREAGVKIAKGNYLLLIDSRVHINNDALKFVCKKLKEDKNVWNAHVDIKRENHLSHFWDVIARIAWRRYFHDPVESNYGIEDFDYYPKGTTCFFCPTDLMLKAMTDFSKHHPGDRTGDKSSNDDTSLLKFISTRARINISPAFRCVYHARASLGKFFKHSYHRGRVFVDGFLHPGGRYFLPLITFLLTPFMLLAVLIIFGGWLIAIAVLGLIVLMLPAVLRVIYKINLQDSLDFTIVLPLFSIAYGAGIWRGLVTKIRAEVFGA